MFMVISTSEYFLTMILFDSASTIRNFRRFYGLYSPCEDVIRSLSCD